MRVKKDNVTQDKRNEIMMIAKEIILQEGITNLSMRRIAKELQQVPGNLYHYFKNKEEIVLSLTRNEYLKMVGVISQKIEGTPEEQIREIMTRYIKAMLDMYDMFDILSHLQEKQVQEQLAILTPGLSKTRTSIKTLCQVLEKGCQEGIFEITNIELQAQIMISATQGMIQRLAIEKPHNQEEIIEAYKDMIIRSIGEKKNEKNNSI